MCVVGVADSDVAQVLKIEHDNDPFGDALRRLQEEIDAADVLVLFNAKRDLHWLRRYGINFLDSRIWDVQLAHFIMTGQESPYPSLNEVAAYYNLGQKDETIENEYWSKRIDTDEIPYEVLARYTVRDLELTRSCYLHQSTKLDGLDFASMRRLINLACIDTLILQEMEWNGLIYDIDASLREADVIRDQIRELDNRLSELVGIADINWNSGDQLSAILYGGEIQHKTRIQDGVYKTGKKAGQPKFKIVVETHVCQQLIHPLAGTELKKEGFYSTDEPTLRQLKAKGKAKEIISVLLERSKLEKLVSSYYEGIPKQIATNAWGESTVHGTLNQCVAATGRLSSSKPNLQNNPKAVDKLFVSRYA